MQKLKYLLHRLAPPSQQLLRVLAIGHATLWLMGSDRANGANIVWTNLNGGSWSVATNWSPNIAPGIADHAIITNSGNYSVVVRANTSVASLSLGGGSGNQTLRIELQDCCSNLALAVANSFTNHGRIVLTNSLTSPTFTAGLFVTNGPLVNAPDGSILTGAATIGPSALNLALRNEGQVTMNGPAILGQPSAQHTNTGTITINSSTINGGLTLNLSGASGSFHNLGAISGALIVNQSGSSPVFRNAGSLIIPANTSAVFNNGTLVVAAGTVVSGSGLLDLNNAQLNLETNLLLGPTPLSLNLGGTTVNGPGALINESTVVSSGDTINAPLVNRGLFRVSSRPSGTTITTSVRGPLTTTPNSILRIELQDCCSSLALAVANGFTNHGQIVLTNSLTSPTYTAGLFVTNGTLVNAPDGSILTGAATIGPSALNLALRNEGQVTMNSPAILGQPSAQHTNTGTITVNGVTSTSGLTLNLSGTSGSFYNLGAISGALIVNQSGSSPVFRNAGSLTIPANFSAVFNSGTLVVAAGTVVSGSGLLDLNNAQLNLETNLLLGPTPLSLNLGGTTVNGPGALINESTVVSGGDTLNAPLVNRGLFRVSSRPSGSSTTSVQGPLTTTPSSILRIELQDCCSSLTLAVADGFTNHGQIVLTNSLTSLTYTAGLFVTNGPLVNAPDGSILTGAATIGPSALNLALRNEGQVTMNGPAILGQPSAQHTNTGTITVNGVTSNSGLTLNLSGTSGSFHNLGAISGPLIVNQSGSSPLFRNAGSLTIPANSSAVFNSGTLAVAAGTVVSGSGVLDLNNAQLNLETDLLLDPTTPSLNLGGTTVNGPGALINESTVVSGGDTLNAPLVNRGLFRVSSRPSGTTITSIQGPLTTTPGSILRIELQDCCSSLALAVANGFTNHGQIVLTNSLSLPTLTAGLFVTNGTLVNAPDGSILTGAATIGPSALNLALRNEGQVTINGPAILGLPSAQHTNTGTFTINSVTSNSGLTLNLSGTSGSFHNLGALSGALIVNQSGSSPLFRNAGSLTIPASSSAVFNNGTLVMAAGTVVSGSGLLDLNNGQLNIETNLLLGPTTPSLNLGGTTVNGPGALINESTVVSGGDTLNAPLVNRGLFRVSSRPSGTTITTSVQGPLTTTPGSILRIELQDCCSSLALAVANGFTNHGQIVLTNSLSLPTFTAGLFVTNGPLVNAPDGSILTGAATIGPSALSLALRNEGQVTMNGPAILGQPSAQHTNTGTFTIHGVTSTSGLTLNLSGASGSFHNLGAISGPLIVNQSGSSPLFRNAGSLDFPAGQVMRFTGGTLGNLLDGTIRGRGRIDVSATTFDNEGDVEPGDPLGTLTFVGTYFQSTNHSLDLELGGLGAGVDYDQLVINGAAHFGGILNIRLVNDFQPSLGDRFKVLRYASVVSDFACIYGLSLPGAGKRLEPVSTRDGLELVCVASTDAPVLQLRRSAGGMLTLCWETNSPGFQLETTTNLTPPIVWQSLGGPATNIIAINPGERQRYYRLIQP